ncbi:class I SAM-dependent methyltransferase [Pseudomonas sp. CGJS7]|uniref:class I SAM-dependent methyltransferase n=1 Tax=Pseudomonas sp. CGJS7 TaxID=3109348 RepID=UPI0030080C3E
MNTRTNTIAADWETHSYYEEAERWTASFWNEGTAFRSFFDKLDIRRTAELACGHGRHAAQIVDRVEKLTLVDVNRSNLDACKNRFRDRKNVTYVKTDGDSLRDIPNASQTAVFSYDAMVHFEADTILLYLGEIARVLAPGGRALLHYSNLHSMPAIEYGQGPHMRSFFSETMMIHFAHRRGLKRVDSRTLDWGHEPTYHALDALTLLEKTA